MPRVPPKTLLSGPNSRLALDGKLSQAAAHPDHVFVRTKHHRHKPDTKQREKHHKTTLNPTCDYKPNVKQRLLGPSLD